VVHETESRLWRKPVSAIAALAVVYVIVAYGLMPAYWKHYVRRHPVLEDAPHLTHTSSGLPGDPINVALIGSEDDVLRAMKAAGWILAARLGVRADLGIAGDAVLGRSDPAAPVSNLYMFGRREDVAFEQQVGGTPRERHHVRFWKSDHLDDNGRLTWMGAAVYDRGVGISHTTGQITHTIAPAIDDERDYLFQCLQKAGVLLEWHAIDGYHEILEGKNGDGNPWRTDGRLFVGVVHERK
jgi:hypothetical protein